MLHAGIGPTHLNALLTSINLPPVGENTPKAREREIGPAIESVAKKSCEETTEIEKRFCSSEENSGAETINMGLRMIWAGKSGERATIALQVILLLHLWLQPTTFCLTLGYK